MSRLLIVDDEANMTRLLGAMLADLGHETAAAGRVADAGRLLQQQRFDIVLADYRLPDGDGLDVLRHAREADPTIPVIVLTAHATIELAVAAMKAGAFDFVTKPFDPDAIETILARAGNHVRLVRENLRLRDEVDRLRVANDVVGESPAIQRLREDIARVAPTLATVLITGETGTGKELVARAIHAASDRADHPFVPVNCAAFTETLLESELFGHEKGAFTGADRLRQGLFEAADGGTLFLDEAGEMPLSLQAKLLRVLMDRQIVRVGSTTPRQVDVRILAATHRDLRQRIADGHFREDLYYRLAVVPIAVPPLRERPQDIPLLVHHFQRLVASDLRLPPREFTPEALAALVAYPFPGNIRELRNLIERAYILARQPEITLDDLPPDVAGRPASSGAAALADTIDAWVEALPPEHELRTTLDSVERACLIRALREAGGVQAAAARQLGLTRSDMTYKVRKYQLESYLRS